MWNRSVSGTFVVAIQLLSSAKSPASHFASVSWPRRNDRKETGTEGLGKHDTDLTLSNPISQDQQGLALSGARPPPKRPHLFCLHQRP